MQAFKLFFKIVPRKFLGVFIIYTIIFVGLMAFFSSSGGFSQTGDTFVLSKVRISIINHDQTPLANGLETYLNSISKPVDINADEESLKDALFFRQTEFIVIIPEGFQNSFTSSTPQKLETMSVPDSISAEYAKTIINSYLNTARLYLIADPSMPVETVNERVVADISMEVNISFLGSNNGKNLSDLNMYFNFLSYILIAMLISMIGRIMLIFNNKEIKMRNFSAPLSAKNYNIQLILSNLSIAFIVWLVFVMLAFVINRNTLTQVGAYLFIVNSLVLMIVCLGISFFVASFASKNAIDPIGNCFSLGLSFLGGAFVPQILLSDFLKTIGNFNPIFWYVKVNDTIGNLTTINQSTLQPIFYGMVVQLAFALAFLAVALVIIKQKRYAN